MRIKKFELILRESQSFCWDSQGPKSFRDAETVYKFITDDNTLALASRPEEHMVALSLNIKGELTGMIESTIGTLCETNVNIKNLIQFAILSNSAALILIHNHPSGDYSVSQDDIYATEKIEKALKLVDIHLVDHIVVGTKGYTSMRAEGIIPSF